jgi:hypothetical protein
MEKGCPAYQLSGIIPIKKQLIAKELKSPFILLLQSGTIY